jgi:integrase/recombinase XerC
MHVLPARAGDHGRDIIDLFTLDPYIDAYVRERRQKGEVAPSTISDLRSRLHSLSVSFGARPITRFGEVAVDRWLRTIGHMRPASKRAYLSTVKTFARWMVRRGHLRQDPTEDCARIREPRRDPRALPAAVVARLLNSRPDLRSQAILWLMLGVGLRCCEVAWLRVEDFDAIGLTLFVIGKGSHERTLPAPQILGSKLNAYIRSTSSTSGPLIRSETNPAHGLEPASVSQLVTGWMWECGIKHRPHDGISAHALRHTCLSDVAEVCKDMRVVMALGGHSNLATASVYQQRMELERMRDAVEGRTYQAA